MNEINQDDRIQDRVEDTPTDSQGETPMTEEDFSEAYQKLPMWQHVVLLLLFLAGMAAIIIGVDFIIALATELLKRLF